MDSNPHNLKTVDEKPSGYLDADEFIAFCNRKKIIIKRKDNLPRFCKNNDIKMIKIKRIGSSGSTPTCYRIPSESKINEIINNLKSNNNSLLGREIVKKKKEKILEVFDKAEDQTESRTSIAEKVSEILGTPCNRKLVRSVLDKKRSSKLNKLKKIS